MNTTAHPRQETMTPRQRVLAAINHQSPDRVPIDLGGNQTGIHNLAYRALLKHLGIHDPNSSSWTRSSSLPSLARRCWSGFTSIRATSPPKRPDSFQGGIEQNTPRRAAVARPARRVRRGLVDARRPSVLYGHLVPPAGRRDQGRHCQIPVSQGRRSEPFRRAAATGAEDPQRNALRPGERHFGRGL